MLGLEVEVHEEASDTVDSGSGHPPEHRRPPRRCLPAAPVELWVSTGPESSGNEDLQMEPLIIALPTDRETAEVQIVVNGVIEFNDVGPLPRWQLCL